jgi:hypothetical protein
MRHYTFSIQVKNASAVTEVVLTESQIKFIHLEAKGFTQDAAAKYCDMSRGTLHNALINFNSQTGCRNAQGRVGWAVEQRILIVKDREILIAPEYKVVH